MTAEQLLAELRDDGFSVWHEAGKLWVKPTARLSDDQRRDVREHRDVLVALLEAESLRLAVALDGWEPAEPTPVHPVPMREADADLVGWFREARQAGRLPRGPFELAPAQTVGDPEQLYRWVEERLQGEQGSAVVSEAECTIRKLRRIVEGS